MKNIIEGLGLTGTDTIKDLIKVMTESNIKKVDISYTELWCSPNSLDEIHLDEIKDSEYSTIEDFIHNNKVDSEMFPCDLDHSEDVEMKITPSSITKN